MTQALGEMTYNFRLYEAIKNNYGSQTKFCVDLGLSRTILSGIINGRINPSLDEIHKMAELLDTTPADLFDT